MTDQAMLPAKTRTDSGYSQLLKRIRAEGLLRRRPLYYTLLFTAVLGALAVGVAGFVLIGDSWWQLATAAYFAVVFTQIGFLGHDAGHRQIFRTKRANDLAGLLLGNLGIGLAFGWWIDKHRRHHTNPNDTDLDPDVSGEALAFTAAQAHARRGLGRLLARYQAWLFFPMLLLEGLALHVAGLKAVRKPGYPRRVTEMVLLLAHVVIALAVVFTVLSPLKALAFIAVQQGLFGLYLGCSFAPNHKGMPTMTAADEADFLRKQVLTTRNVTSSRFNEILLGGLNFQIEHHLFPNMPRVALRRARPFVQAHLAGQNLAYMETSLVGCYRLALGHLDSVGRVTATSPADFDDRQRQE